MKQISGMEFESEVLHSATPVVVDFYTSECHPCRMLAPILQEWEAEAQGLRVVKVDAAAEGALASSYGVRAVPTMLLFSGGKCLAQTSGLKSKAHLQKWYEESLRSA